MSQKSILCKIITLFSIVSVLPIFGSIVFMREFEGEKHVWLSGDQGQNLKQITPSQKNGFLESSPWHLYPDIDASGQKVAYVRGDAQSTEIVVQTLASGEIRIVSEKQGLQLHPHFSGDGKTLAFTRPRQTGLKSSNIVIANLVQESQPRLIESESNCYFPVLSSDGTFLVYQRDLTKTEREIVVLDLNTNIEMILPVKFHKNMAPALSADDSWIAFTSQLELGWNIFAFNRLTGELKQVTLTEGFNFAPTFKPNGSIVYASNHSGQFQLYEIPKSTWQKGPTDGELLIQLPGDLYAPNSGGMSNLEMEPLPDIPAPARSSFGAIRHGKDIYVIGGHQGPEHTYPKESFLNRVDVLNLETRKWKEAAPRLDASHGFSLATFGRYIYAFGGFAYATPEQEFKPKWRSLDSIERLDTVTNTWETVGKLPRRRSSYAIATVKNKAYLIGGWDSTPRFNNDYDGVFQRKIEVFDFETETVSEAPFDLPDPLRRAFSSVTNGQEIFLVGGLGQGATHFELLDTVTALNPETGVFRELPPLSFPTFAPAAGLLGDTLFVFGGMFRLNPKEYVYVNHIFGSDLNNGWSHVGRYLRDAKGFAQVVSTDDSLIVLGGHKYEGNIDSPTPSVDKFRINKL